MTPRTSALLALFLLHIVAGVVSSFLSADAPAVSSAFLLGIIFCQTCLLGMWCGLGTTRWMIRLIGLSVGSLYLAVELGLGISELDDEIIIFVVLPCILVAMATWLVRLFRGAVQLVDAAQSDLKEGLQFSIRHLMLLTFAVACCTAVGKLLAPNIRGLDTLATVVVLGLCYVSVALSSIWAILGTGRPVARSFFVVVIAIIAGLVGGNAVDQDHEMAFWLSTTTLQAVLLVVSLSVIRRVGYRFVAQRSGSRP